jgi:paraquat-inducible protein B
LIGAFIVGGLALLIAAVFTLTSADLFSKNETYVSFFEGSVFGLNIGASVAFRGIKIGEVTEIYGVITGDSLQTHVAVIYELDARKIRDPGAFTEKWEGLDYRQRLQHMIDSGVRAKLEMASLITGQLFVDLDFYEDPQPYMIDFDLGYPEIPTVPSLLDELRDSARGAISELTATPLSATVEELRLILVDINQAIDSEELGETMENLRDLTGSLNRLASHMDEQSGTVVTELEATSQSAQATLEQARSTLEAIEKTAVQGTEFQYQVAKALDQMSDAARAIRVLAEYLERHPEALVTGKDPPK